MTYRILSSRLPGTSQFLSRCQGAASSYHYRHLARLCQYNVGFRTPVLLRRGGLCGTMSGHCIKGDVCMPAKYPDEFKRNVILLYEQGVSAQALCKELHIAFSTFYEWRTDYRSANAVPQSRSPFTATMARSTHRERYASSSGLAKSGNPFPCLDIRLTTPCPSPSFPRSKKKRRIVEHIPRRGTSSKA